MDEISSISKGIFIFKNDKSIQKLRKKKARLVNSFAEHEDWYLTFQSTWKETEKQIENLQAAGYEKILSSLLTFIREIDFDDSSNLQTAVLLTGVNQTDHLKQFETLSSQISNNVFSLITILQSRDCPNIKSTVEKLVNGFISQHNDEDQECPQLKKKQNTFPVLEAWFRHNYRSSKTRPSLVVIIADFEQFNSSCIQDLISIMCSYTDRLPLVLIIGIATAFKTLHNVLPAHITNKLDANVFQSEPSTVMLNKILDEVILTHRSAFQLSGKSFKILMDIFLFCDYSLHSFVKGYKVFMLEHFSNRRLATLLYRMDDDQISELSHEQCEYVRRSCPSFRTFVESGNNQLKIDLLTNDNFLKQSLLEHALKFRLYMFQFYCSLRILVVLISDLPRNELGKLVRELYPMCITSDVTKLDEYKECFKLLRFSAKDKFLEKLDNVTKTVESYLEDKFASDDDKLDFQNILQSLKVHRTKIAEAGMSPSKEASRWTPKVQTPSSEAKKTGVTSRQEMMSKLKEGVKNNPTRMLTEYERHLWDCIEYLNELMEKYLRPIQEAPAFNEFFVFSDSHSVRRQIVGAPRGSLHNALSNPQLYLQCSCCTLSENEQLLVTLPDTSTAYKLHLECNKSINLYDWLQAFATVIEVNEGEDEEIRPEVQARFTRSIAELQFLGFIKQGKHKADHVSRLTW